jgi:hypothetical protein
MSSIKATLQLEIQARKSKKKHHTNKVFIETVRKNDVLSGRGNGVNRHSGNVQLRDLINQEKESYLRSFKKDKKKFAKDILTKIRAQTPPGRFLRTDKDTSFWYEIPDEGRRGALEKIRQGLREGAAELMETLEVKKTESTSEKNKEKTSTSPVFEQMEDTSDSNILVDTAEGVYDRKTEKETLVKAKFEDFFQNEMESRRVDEGSQRKKYKKKKRNRSSRKMHDTTPASSTSVQSINLDNLEVQSSLSSLNGAKLVKVFD